jgi:branched-chain amino acid transport system substrate-binding protein
MVSCWVVTQWVRRRLIKERHYSNMRKRHHGSTELAGFVLAVVVLAGCSISGGSSGGGGNKSLCIATDFPISGTDASKGQPAENGATLAVTQAKLQGGYTLTIRHFDDAVSGVHNPTRGLTNLTNMVNDPCIIAMVGPYDDAVAVAEIPIAANSGLAIISPANTNPGLTKESYAAPYGLTFNTIHPPGKPESYFRITTTDDVEGAAGAQVALEMAKKKAYVVDDAQPQGKNIAAFFAQAFTSHGGAVSGTASITGTDTTQINALVASIKAANPDVVYYGGLTATGAALRAAMSSGGLAGVPMLGNNGIANDAMFVQSAGAAAEGTLATVAAPDVSALTSPAALQFVKDYRAKFNSAPTAYSSMAFDAANVEVAAINAVIAAGQTPTRANVLDQIAHTSYDGLTGHITFDVNGDNASSKVISVYVVRNGAWVYVKQITG